MHTPDRATPISERLQRSSSRDARIFAVGPLMKASRSLSDDLNKAEQALKAANSSKAMNMAFHGGNLEDATRFYEEQQHKKNEERQQAEAQVKNLKSEQLIMLEAAQLGHEDPTEWLSGEEERLAAAQAINFRSKQQLEMSHAHGRGPEQVINAKKLDELQEEMKSNANKMGAIVRLRNRL